MTEEATRYDASHIQVLEGWEAVRKRPGMYIGSTGERGLNQLVFEAADRAVNETLARGSGSIDITLMPDGGVCVADDGPGVPPDEPEGANGPGLEALLTRMQAGAGPGGRHDVMLGFCGVGPAGVNALSRRMTAEVRRDGVRWVQEYARGVAVTPPTEAGAANGSGTTLAFWPDADIFGTAECSFDGLAERFRELAFLNQGLEVSLTDRRGPGEPLSARFRFPGGVRDFAVFLDSHMPEPAPADIIAFEHEDPRMAGVMEVAFRWCGSHEERVRSFANSRPTEGGTHELGFRDGVVAAVTAYARQQQSSAATDPGLGADRIGAGLTAVVSVKLDRPEFVGPTRGVLGNSEVRDCVGQAVQDHLGRWLKEQQGRAAAVIDRIVQGASRN
ncbi:ATP-binding protein [Streptomyces sp. NPDC021080]|uniref:ATP-binding protein n=1 Tax=Streptomyces sp. NPDC021080 TaxID=3365110 RepID=UPI0037B26AA4